MCVCVRLRISLPRIQLAQWFIDVLDRESHIFAQKPKIGQIGQCAGHACQPRCWTAGLQATRAWPVRWPICPAHWLRIGSACMDIRPSPKMNVLVYFSTTVCHMLCNHNVAAASTVPIYNHFRCLMPFSH